MDWHTRSPADVCEALETTTAGLDTNTARERRETVGPNELARDRGRRPLRILLTQFSNALIWILLIATVLSVLV